MSNTILLKLSPLTEHQKKFLCAHVLRQRTRVAQEASSVKQLEKPQDSKEEDGRGNVETSPSSDEELKTQADRVTEQGDQLEDVKAQISTLQSKLEALKDEKHRLFQQLKTVLNEEDEKKKIREQVQKQSEPIMSGDLTDCKVGSMKRSMPLSPGSGLPLTKQQQQQSRGPLLPTPDSSQYPRQSKYFWHGSVTEPVGSSSSPRHSHGTRIHSYSAARANVPEQRFGMAPHHHDAVHQGASYQQFNPSQSLYGSMSNITSPGGSQTGTTSGISYGQAPSQGFLSMQHHSHPYQQLSEHGQISLSLDMSGLYPHQDVPYIGQSAMASSNQSVTEYPQLYNQIHDPRQHRLMEEGHVPCANPVHPPGRESRLKK